MKKTTTRIEEVDGKKYARIETVEVEVKPFWNDGYRNSHPIRLTEKAPSFKSRW